jgi:hypothetical protein
MGVFNKNVLASVTQSIGLGDKSNMRLSLANLPLGGILGKSGDGRNVMQPQVLSSTPGAELDWRVRLSLPPKASGFYKEKGLMTPLEQTNGLIWPITPTIIIQHSAQYTPQEPVHTNYPYYAYNNSRVDAMSIIGNFPVQNATEGKYWLAALHFLRSVSKMFYGPDMNQGNPPQILRLNGYGEHIFKDVPVIVEQVTVELRESVDYISVGTELPKTMNKNKKGKGPSRANQRLSQNKTGDPSVEVTRVPTDSVFTVLVQPVYSRKRIKDKFNLKDFASGRLAKDGFI